MLSLSERCVIDFSTKFLGSTLPVLFEKKEGKLWSGLTGNYIRVYAHAEGDLLNEIAAVNIEDIIKDGVSGKIKNWPRCNYAPNTDS